MVSSASARMSSSFEQSAAIQSTSMPAAFSSAAASSRSSALRELRMMLGAGFAQRLGQLQAQAARAAGHEGGLAFEVEQLLDGTGHGVSWCVVIGFAFAVMDGGMRGCG
jgi:hypothetical protein